MPRIDYKDFEVVITCIEAGKRYKAFAKCPLSGSSQHVPFDMADITLDGFLATAPAEQSMRHITTNADRQTKTLPLLFDRPFDKQKAKEFGDRLFRAVFKNSIRSHFDTSAAKSSELRLHLNLTDAPELAALPWEYLHNSEKDHFFAQFRGTPIVRYQSQSIPSKPLKVELPVRILVMTAIPKGYEELDVTHELEAIRKGIEGIGSSGLINVEMLSKGTVNALHEKLEEAKKEGRPFHILHFIGHGVFDPQKGEGALVLEDDSGEAKFTSGDEFGNGLQRFNDNLRLVVLNACEGARASISNSYSGFAQKVMQCAEIPAAIGMQFRISDKAAISFAEKFYKAIAEGMPLESALADARMHLYSNSNEEWATPILYLQSQDGYILEIQGGPSPPPDDLSEHFKLVGDAFDDGQLSIFLGLNVNLCGRELLPTWKPGKVLPAPVELCDYLRDQYGSPLVGAPLARLAQHLSIKDSRFTRKLPVEFHESFSVKDYLPPLYPPLAGIVALRQKLMEENNDPIGDDPIRRHFIIVTTNYDDCIERAFKVNKVDDYHVISYDLLGGQGGVFRHTLVRGKEVAPSVSIDNPNGYTGLRDKFPIILKLPGGVESRTLNFAVTEDHFFVLASRVMNLLPSDVVAKLNSSAHLYLGYSPRDWYFRALLFSLCKGRQPRGQSWAVVPDAKDENIDYWTACDVEVITAPLDNYAVKLRNALEGYARRKGGADE